MAGKGGDRCDLAPSSLTKRSTLMYMLKPMLSFFSATSFSWAVSMSAPVHNSGTPA